MKDKSIEIEQISKQISNLKNNFNQSTPIIDGIVDLIEYDKASIKIMWILKEVNSENDTDEWDLRDAIKNLKTEKGIKKGWASTFNPIVYTTFGILHNLYWEEIENTNDNPNIIDVLKKIAYVNVKKIPGKSVAIKSELEIAFKEHKSILKSQIELYNPDVIICGGTFNIIKDVFQNLNNKTAIHPFSSYENKNTIIIDAYHPNNRTVTQEKYCNIIIENVIKGNKPTHNKSYKNNA
ncbi:hypothetical protein [Algibacter sp. R77976]|uniref:hypothetical protein n=1 Tax=Algibacter sp. R77976 TaxID=3093873 RepID=UPI0037CA5B72